jgi:hypothetical protein
MLQNISKLNPTPSLQAQGKEEMHVQQPVAAPDLDLTQVDLSISAVSHQTKTGPRLLLILPWLVMGGAERFTLNLMDQLARRGWQFSIVTTAPSENPWQVEFEKRTPEIFILPDLISLVDYPRYLRQLIASPD